MELSRTAAVLPPLRALFGRRKPVSRRPRRVRGFGPAQQQRRLRGVGRSRRRVRTAAQSRFQRRDDVRRRQLPARHRPALAHQFGIGLPEAGRPSAKPDRHHRRAGQQGNVSGTRRDRRRVDQERPDVQRRRRPRSHPIGGRVAVAANPATFRRRSGRICCAGSAFPSSPIRRKSGAICRITIRRG